MLGIGYALLVEREVSYIDTNQLTSHISQELFLKEIAGIIPNLTIGQASFYLLAK